MSFEPQFHALMPHTVTLEAPTGRDAQGRATYVGSVVKSYRARVTGPVQDIRKSDSSLREPLYTVWVDCGNDTVTAEYRLTLPNDAVWESRVPILFSVGRVSDGLGNHHAKITCGFMYHRQGQT